MSDAIATAYLVATAIIAVLIAAGSAYFLLVGEIGMALWLMLLCIITMLSFLQVLFSWRYQ